MKKKKILALCLSIVMLLVCFPVTATTPGTSTPLETEASVTNEQASANDISTADEYTTKTIEFVSDEIIGNVEEIPALREENVKHFRLSNGSYEAVSFASAIHRKDKNGVWQDIDNSLTLKSVNDKQGYYTEDSRISFANTFKYGSELFSLNENGYAISMLPISSEKVTAGAVQLSLPTAPVVTNAQKRTDSKIFDSVESAIQFDNKTSIVYNDIRANTDIEYVLDGNDIKENIIVKAKSDSYEYAFQLNLTGLIAELDQSGNILLRDSKTENIKYTIPAPYMYDSNGEYSYDVNYTLQAASSEKYLLIVSASDEWINDESREFPVTIDPTIQGIIWVDTYIDSENPNVSYATSGVLYASDTKTTLIKPYMPSLPLNISRIDSAELYVSYYGAEADFDIGLYEVVGMIDTNTTYSNKPKISTTKLSEQTVSSSIPTLQTINFPITTIFSNWYYSGAIAYGVAIKNSSGTQDTVAIKSSETTSSPYLRVVYTQQIPDGVYAIKNGYGESYWMTIENDSGESGTLVQHVNSAESPVTSFDRLSLFKISGSNGLYIIRLMTNNNLTLAISNGKVVTKEIPSRDEDVLDEDKFGITVNGYGYTIRPYGSPYLISMQRTNIEDLTGVLQENSNEKANWTFEQYVGLERWGSTIYFPSEFYVGDLCQFSAIVWSTMIDCNAHVITIDDEYSYYATYSVDTVSGKTNVMLHQNGDFKVNVLIHNGSDSNYYGLSYDFQATLVVDEGSYFIKNKDTETYVQIDDDDEPNYNTNGSLLELWDFDGEEYQRWEFIHIQDGYYKIISEKSGLAICVQSSYLNTDEEALIQEPYSDLSRKKWKITKSSSGAYILRPKSKESYNTDWCMCAGDQFLWIDSGLNVEQSVYNNDDNYKDEWVLELLDEFKVIFYGISNSGHDHSSCLTDVKADLHDAGFNNVALKTGAINSSVCLANLKGSSVFTSRSHGHLIVWNGTTIAASTGIVLNDEEETRMVALYSHPYDNMTLGSTSITTADSFDGLNMALFIGCETAYDGTTGRNLPAIVVTQGAKVTVGFSDTINCNDANEWTEDFYLYLIEGHTVQESVDYASINQSIASGLRSAVVCGDGDYRISE